MEFNKNISFKLILFQFIQNSLFINKYNMIQFFLSGVSLLFLMTWYFMYYKPKNTIRQFAKNAQKMGYRVKLMPFQFMKYYLMQYLYQDQKSLRIFKQDFSHYDLIVGNMYSNLSLTPSHPKILKDVFNQVSKLPKHEFVTQVFQILNEGGIPFSQGEQWKRKRKIISSVFHFDFLNSIISVIKDQIQLEFKQVDQKILKGQTINLAKSFTRILSSVIAICFFGTNIKNYKIQGLPYCQYYVQFLDLISDFAFSKQHMFLRTLGYRYGLTAKSRQIKRRFKILQTVAKQVTCTELEKIKNHEESRKNLITSLYQAGYLSKTNKSRSQGYTISQLSGEFFAFYGAGTDTTANAANLALHYLSNNQQLVDKITEQLQIVKKQNLNQPQKLKKLKWQDAVFNETLRIGGPASGLFQRRAVQKLTIGGLQIPQNTTISVMPIINSYMEEHFPEPYDFKPQRWIDQHKIQPFVFIPFGAGQRNCLGQYLAKIQFKMLISYVLEKYQFKAVNPIKMRVQFVYQTKSGQFEMKLKSKVK